MPQACADATSPRRDVASGWTGGPSGYPRCCESLSADPRPRTMVKRRTARGARQAWRPCDASGATSWTPLVDRQSSAQQEPFTAPGEGIRPLQRIPQTNLMRACTHAPHQLRYRQ